MVHSLQPLCPLPAQTGSWYSQCKASPQGKAEMFYQYQKHAASSLMAPAVFATEKAQQAAMRKDIPQDPLRIPW